MRQAVGRASFRWQGSRSAFLVPLVVFGVAVFLGIGLYCRTLSEEPDEENVIDASVSCETQDDILRLSALEAIAGKGRLENDMNWIGF